MYLKGKWGFIAFIAMATTLLPGLLITLQAQDTVPTYGCTGSGNILIAFIYGPYGETVTNYVGASACVGGDCASGAGIDKASATLQYDGGIPCQPSSTKQCSPYSEAHCTFSWAFPDGTSGGATLLPGERSDDVEQISIISTFIGKYRRHMLYGIA